MMRGNFLMMNAEAGDPSLVYEVANVVSTSPLSVALATAFPDGFPADAGSFEGILQVQNAIGKLNQNHIIWSPDDGTVNNGCFFRSTATQYNVGNVSRNTAGDIVNCYPGDNTYDEIDNTFLVRLSWLINDFWYGAFYNQTLDIGAVDPSPASGGVGFTLGTNIVIMGGSAWSSTTEVGTLVSGKWYNEAKGQDWAYSIVP